VFENRELRKRFGLKREGGEVRGGFCWENLRERVHLKDLRLGGRIILKCVLNRFGDHGLD
jgi:hypothetical protein